jgi:uncharacterized membrane protein
MVKNLLAGLSSVLVLRVVFSIYTVYRGLAPGKATGLIGIMANTIANPILWIASLIVFFLAFRLVR